MENREQKQREYLLNLLNKEPKSEIQLQSKCSELLYWFYPNDWKRLVCVNNNDRRANTNNVGIVPGASDTYWLGMSGRVLFIEFKFGQTAKQSIKQIEWEQLCISLGYQYLLCYSEINFWKLIGLDIPTHLDIPKSITHYSK